MGIKFMDKMAHLRQMKVQTTALPFKFILLILVEVFQFLR